MPLKTFKRYGITRVNGFVPLIRSNRTSRNAKTIMSHLKRLSGTKRSLKTIMFRLKRSIGTICHRRLIPYHLKRSIGTKYRTKHILSRLKRFRGTKPEQIVVRISPTHQDNNTGNRHPSTTASLTPATRTCTPIRQTKRQRNGSTEMDTVPRKIVIQRIIRVDSPVYP